MLQYIMLIMVSSPEGPTLLSAIVAFTSHSQWHDNGLVSTTGCMRSPKFMEITLLERKVVYGDLPGPLAGMVGFDVFARAIVQFPSLDNDFEQCQGSYIVGENTGRQRSASTSSQHKCRIQLWPPFRSKRDMPSWMAALNWQPLCMVGSTLALLCSSDALTCSSIASFLHRHAL